MDPFDSAQTAPVWARVYSKTAAASPEAPSAQTQTEQTAQDLPALLLEQIDDERRDSATYYFAARRAGEDAALLRRTAQEESGHAKKLSALYFLLTGACPPATRLPGTYPGDLRTLLAQRYQGELEGAAGYRAAAEQYPLHAALFNQLAEDEQLHAQRILELTERRL